MSLSSIIAEVVFENEHDGVVDRHAAINAALPMVLADSELVDRLLRSELNKMIKDHLCRAVRAADASPTQASLFGLRPAHPLDDADNIIKQTRALSRIEFQGLIALRRRQVKADLAYLKLLEEAASTTADIWDRNPEWVWGQVEDAYAAQSAAA